MSENNAFVHLHVHSEYSLLDGACRIEKLVHRAIELGQPALAVTDHGNMYAAVEFYNAAKKAGIKPVIGCEAYVARRSRHKKERGADSDPFHLVLLCKNETGYKNLIKILSKAWTEGFYNRPRIDRELLSAHHEGIIALSGCIAGEIASALRENNFQGAQEAAKWYKSLFGEDYYIELQNQGISDQPGLNRLLASIAEKESIGLVATNDVHYINAEDADTHKVLMCIQTNTTVDSENAMEFPTKEFYLKSGQEMAAAFAEYPSALANTLEIAEKCDFEFEFGVTKLPYFNTPADCPDHFEYLRRQATAGLDRLYKENRAEAQERLEYELNTINGMGYTDYFLIVADFINYAKSRDIPVGPGRGSGASSLTGYCLGITGVDPLRYGLMFERFLNPERVSMPDFDIDFCQNRRQEVIDYVVGKYGSDHVAQIVTFGTMKARGAVRDVGRALGMSYQEVDTIAKLIPHNPEATLENVMALEESPLAQRCKEDEKAEKLVMTAMQLEGIARHASTHAAGVVITKDAASEYIPLAVNGDAVVTQYTMTQLEDLGLLKIDFLGLRYLTVIREAEQHIRKKIPGFSIQNASESDKKIFKMLAKGDTDGVFQLESGGMRQLLIDMKINSLEDILVAISLYRPGPRESIPRYIECRNNPAKTRYHHELLKNALESTHGVIVFQEQVTQICRDVGGFSYGQADLVRRAMAKKKPAEMERQRRRFIYGETAESGEVLIPGALRLGVPQQTAELIFDEMEAFAGYGFNKCHAAPYALIAYQTAFLRANYYKEYMAALISSTMGEPKAAQYIEDCKRHGERVLPPDVNTGYRDFMPCGEGIRFGLLGIKNLGAAVIDSIVSSRRTGGPYKDFYDFYKRNSGHEMNSRALESLIYAGALDCLGYSRRSLITAADKIVTAVSDENRTNIEGQIGLFEGTEDAAPTLTVEEISEFSSEELLSREREVTGLFISSHPLDRFSKLLAEGKHTPIIQLTTGNSMAYDNKTVTLIGMVEKKTTKQTKTGERMAFVNLEDKTGRLEVIVFAKLYAAAGELLKDGSVVRISGRVSVREADESEENDAEVKVIAAKITPPQESGSEAQRQPRRPGGGTGLYLRLPSAESREMQQAGDIARDCPGETPLFVYFTATGKLTAAPRSMSVNPTPELCRRLSQLLGEENVKLVERPQ